MTKMDLDQDKKLFDEQRLKKTLEDLRRDKEIIKLEIEYLKEEYEKKYSTLKKQIENTKNDKFDLSTRDHNKQPRQDRDFWRGFSRGFSMGFSIFILYGVTTVLFPNLINKVNRNIASVVDVKEQKKLDAIYLTTGYIQTWQNTEFRETFQEDLKIFLSVKLRLDENLYSELISAQDEYIINIMQVSRELNASNRNLELEKLYKYEKQLQNKAEFILKSSANYLEYKNFLQESYVKFKTKHH